MTGVGGMVGPTVGSVYRAHSSAHADGTGQERGLQSGRALKFGCGLRTV